MERSPALSIKYSMESHDSEGLGVSILIYVAAVFGVLAVFVLPVYYATGPTVYDSPPLARSGPLQGGPAYTHRDSARHTLAVLKRETLIDPAVLAALNSKAKKTAQPRRSAPQATKRATRTDIAGLQAGQERTSIFPFSLF